MRPEEVIRRHLDAHGRRVDAIVDYLLASFEFEEWNQETVASIGEALAEVGIWSYPPLSEIGPDGHFTLFVGEPERGRRRILGRWFQRSATAHQTAAQLQRERSDRQPDWSVLQRRAAAAVSVQQAHEALVGARAELDDARAAEKRLVEALAERERRLYELERKAAALGRKSADERKRHVDLQRKLRVLTKHQRREEDEANGQRARLERALSGLDLTAVVIRADAERLATEASDREQQLIEARDNAANAVAGEDPGATDRELRELIEAAAAAGREHDASRARLRRKEAAVGAANAGVARAEEALTRTLAEVEGYRAEQTRIEAQLGELKDSEGRVWETVDLCRSEVDEIRARLEQARATAEERQARVTEMETLLAAWQRELEQGGGPAAPGRQAA